jgi:hypothetical protein
MFQFPAFPPCYARYREMNLGRFPDLGHPRIKACLAAPRGISQLCHVLRRLWTPRHPPYTLTSLTTLFLAIAVSYLRLPTLLSKSAAPCDALLEFFQLYKSDLDTSTGGAPGGGDRIRTDDRLVANQVLYQLSYAPGARSSPSMSSTSWPPLEGGGPDRSRTCDLPLIRRTL